MKNIYFKKYLKQRDKLPDHLREKYGKVYFYAYSDLDTDLKLAENWILLTESEMIVNDRKVAYSSISKVALKDGGSANNLSLLNKHDEIIETIWFSNRQSVCFGQIKYLLENTDKSLSPLAEDADTLYQKSMLAPLLKKQGSTEIAKQKVVWRLLSYMKPYRKEVTIGMVGAIGMTLVSLLPAYLSGRLIDEIIRPFQDGGMKQEEAIKIGFIVIAALATSYLIREFFVWLRLKKMSVMGEKIARDLRKELFEHLQKLELDFYSSRQTGSIISRVSSDTDRIWDFIAFGVVEVSIALIMLVSLSSVLITMDWKLGLMMTVPVPLLIFAIFKHGQRMQRLFLKCWRKWSELTGVLSDTIPGIQVVKSFNQENKEVRRFNEKNENAIEEFNGVHESWTKFWPGLMLSIKFIMISVWAMALPRLLTQEASLNYLSAGTFVSFLLYMTMFSAPIEIIGQMARMMNRATSSAYRIFEILDTPVSLKRTENSIVHDVNGKIEFRDVIFSYDGIRNILKGLNFEIKPGEMIGLVGPSGGGKSTLTKLINRFYDVTSGQITIDGHDVKELELGSLRKQVGIVHQDPYLFHGSVLENICYGSEEVDLPKVIEAARVANAHDFIMKFKDGYETIVGERGQTLSGGERQRISIARAILNDPKILILDEATSAVDTETERNIQEALDKVVEGRTVLAIAHRLSTLRKANRLFVIKEGQIVEVGTHRDLIEKDGEYKKLQDMQNEMHELMHGKSEVTYGV
jgi:ATP-binding cassette subfamily B protein